MSRCPKLKTERQIVLTEAATQFNYSFPPCTTVRGVPHDTFDMMKMGTHLPIVRLGGEFNQMTPWKIPQRWSIEAQGNCKL